MAMKHPKIGTIIGKDYHLTSFLGRGKMGKVFAAKQISLDRQVAIKLLSTHEMSVEERHLLERKISAMSALSHPNITTIHDHGGFGSPPTFYYAMEYLDGGSLRQYLNINGKLSTSSALRLIRPLAEALAYAHEKGCIHHHLKPNNLLFNKNYRHLKLADFGIAPPEIDDDESEMAFVYAAPEQMGCLEEGAPQIDHRTDQYSLGMVLYQMLSGSLPYQAENAAMWKKALSTDPTPLTDSGGPGISSSVEWLVLTMISKSPDRRFTNDESLLAAIDSVEMDVAASVSTRIFAVSSAKYESKKSTSQLDQQFSPTEVAFIENLQTISDSAEEKVMRRYKRAFVFFGVLFLFLLATAISYEFFSNRHRRHPKKDQLSHRISPSPQKKVELELKIHYDFPPPPGYPMPEIVLENQLGHSVKISTGLRVLSGDYKLFSSLPGYLCPENNSSIEIPNSEKFPLEVNMVSKPRRVWKTVVNVTTGKPEKAISFKIDDVSLTEQSLFKPGKYRFDIQFANFQNISRPILLPPGDDPFQFKSILQPLREILFILDSFPLQGDGTPYMLEAYVDGQKVQSHYFQYRQQKHRLRGIIKAPQNAQKILLRAGYYYSQVAIDELYLLTALDSIDVDRLSFLLSSLSSQEKLRHRLEILWEKDQQKLLRLSEQDREQLYQLLTSLVKGKPRRKHPGWKLRWLLDEREAAEARQFYAIHEQPLAFDFAGKIQSWIAFLNKNPQTIFARRIQQNIVYLHRLQKYFHTLQQSVEDCSLSPSERQKIAKLERKISPRDAGKMREKVSEFVKKLGCKNSLQQILKTESE